MNCLYIEQMLIWWQQWWLCRVCVCVRERERGLKKQMMTKALRLKVRNKNSDKTRSWLSSLRGKWELGLVAVRFYLRHLTCWSCAHQFRQPCLSILSSVFRQVYVRERERVFLFVSVSLSPSLSLSLSPSLSLSLSVCLSLSVSLCLFDRSLPNHGESALTALDR